MWRGVESNFARKLVISHGSASKCRCEGLAAATALCHISVFYQVATIVTSLFIALLREFAFDISGDGFNIPFCVLASLIAALVRDGNRMQLLAGKVQLRPQAAAHTL